MDIQQVLIRYWGFSSFRPLQEEIIQSVLSGKDTLALLPTGGGKSICFQVPALAKEGICIVISPLIALMKDQVANLQKRGVKAMAIYSGMSRREIDIAFDNCIYGDIKLLYLSPERLKSELALVRIQQMNVNLLAVDEAHCISEWGYDFRPSYLEIASVRTVLKDTPIIALTATATPKVTQDIIDKLEFKDHRLFQKSFARENLSYVVLYEEGQVRKLEEILTNVKGTGLVYVRNRKKTREVSEYLSRKGIRSDYYHAGLDPKARSAKQENWMNGKCRVMICTNAFGMGIDKPDVRTVVHLDPPESLEAYFQEAGRAGRDGKRAYAVLLYNVSDKLNLERQFALKFPDLQQVKLVYQGLANYFRLAEGSGLDETFEFDISEFCKQYNLKMLETFNALKILELQGWIHNSEATWIPSRIMLTIKKDELYKFQVEHRNYEPLIKMILRAYAGIFDHFVNINEYEISVKLKSTREVIIAALTSLKNQGILQYERQADKPQITFLRPRAAPNNLSLNTELYQFRKSSHRKRMLSVIQYASNKIRCRSLELLNYFGEESDARCGICDICLERNKLELTDLEFEQLTASISEELKGSAHTIQYLLTNFKDHRKEKVIKTIEWLMDSGLVIQNDDNKLEWTN